MADDMSHQEEDCCVHAKTLTLPEDVRMHISALNC